MMNTRDSDCAGTVCNPEWFVFPAVKKRQVAASFSGGEVTSDGGLVLLRQADRKLGLSKALARVLPDPRNPGRIVHPLLTFVRQRLYGLCLGYEDLNDHDHLRLDLAWQTAAERDQALASSPTLCRWENRADRRTGWLVQEILVEQLLVSYLRPSNKDNARHAWAILKLLVQRLRGAWPGVKLVVRADSGFCRWRMLRWCEEHGVGYVIGLAKNERVLALAQPLMARAQVQYESSQNKQRVFGQVRYGAESWDRPRRVLVKAEHGEKGSKPRLVVTNLETQPQAFYDEGYCPRGEMENRIKEQQLGLFSDRTSCHDWWANQFRLLLSSCAYVLLEAVRRLGLAGTELARAQAGTIRLKLLKIGAVVLRNTRRVRLLLSSSYPYQEIFAQVAKAFSTG
jgi:hypothetical protein